MHRIWIFKRIFYESLNATVKGIIKDNLNKMNIPRGNLTIKTKKDDERSKINLKVKINKTIVAFYFWLSVKNLILLYLFIYLMVEKFLSY